MSSVNFDRVFEQTPELRDASEAVRQWANAHQNSRFLDARTLAKELGSKVTFDKLVRVFAQLVAAGRVEVRYGVTLPDGTFAEEFFDQPDAVPPVVFDSAFQPVTVDPKYVVPVYLPHAS
jgi:hypothetical protein